MTGKPSETIDYEAEGFFEGVETDALDARRRLLDYLLDEESVPLDEVRLAVKEKRLMLLPVERALGGAPVYVADEVARMSEFDLELFLDLRRALGLAEPALNQNAYSEYDVKVMRAVRAIMAMGMPLESVREINRVLGSALSQLAATVERNFLTAFLRPDDDEFDIAVRYAEVAKITSPEFSFVLQHLFNLHLREATRVDVLGNEATMDLLSDTRHLAVCFADLVGFTSLGEQIPADQLGLIAERLSTITMGIVEPPVRLVKTIGDAVMLVSPEPEALIDTALALIAAVDREEEGFPQLSAGIAAGEALSRGGDIYGPPVNHASRISDVARPGSVVTTGELHEGFERAYDWTSVGRRKFKGIDEPIEVYRVRAKGGRAREKAAEKAREKAAQDARKAERESEKAQREAGKDAQKAAQTEEKIAKGLERQLQKVEKEREKAEREAAKESEKAAAELAGETPTRPVAEVALKMQETAAKPIVAAREQIKSVMPKKAEKASGKPSEPIAKAILKKATEPAKRVAAGKKSSEPKKPARKATTAINTAAKKQVAKEAAVKKPPATKSTTVKPALEKAAVKPAGKVKKVNSPGAKKTTKPKRAAAGESAAKRAGRGKPKVAGGG